MCEWKEAVVLPILKPGTDPTNPQSYRPISLTSVMCKIMERMITNRLVWFLERNNLINNAQSAYRKARSTLDQLSRLHDSIHKAINNKSFTVGIFIDFSRAYDMLWKDGLLSKLRNMGITGNIYNYINDFLTERSLRVKIGNTLSENFRLQNGTPQGSVISPILFLLMINDMPASNDNKTMCSLYADDSALWKTGKNLNFIFIELQKQMNKISKWCNKWGFKINEEKTVMMIFTRKSISKYSNLNIKINNKVIKIVDKVKFLGLIFDPRLTWKEHIKHLADKSKSKINLLRSLTGQNWGASKKSLLAIYRTLIRSRLEYGCHVLYTASKGVLKQLDTIQASCLRICCGAMISTPIHALQVECGEMPLSLRRHKLQLQYAIKLQASRNNPAKSIIIDSWETHYGKYKVGKEPMAKIVKEYMETLNYTVEEQEISDTPPWHFSHTDIDMKLREVISKKDCPEIIKHYALEFMEKYKHFTKIFTDGSKLENGRVGSAYYIPEQTKEHFRLTNHSSVFASELVAIEQALHWLVTNHISKPIVIFTDSLSSVEAIQSQTSDSKPNLILRILKILKALQLQNCPVTIAWIPSHVGIIGNERADALCKEATSHPTVDIEVGKELKDAYKDIDKHITTLWQKEYDSQTSGLHYKRLEPDVSNKIQFKYRRGKERLITRLRLGHCRLNHYLHKIGQHPDGKCNHCKTQETIEHFLLECKHYNVIEQIGKVKHISYNKLPKSVQEILSNRTYDDALYATIRKLNRNL